MEISRSGHLYRYLTSPVFGLFAHRYEWDSMSLPHSMCSLTTAVFLRVLMTAFVTYLVSAGLGGLINTLLNVWDLLFDPTYVPYLWSGRVPSNAIEGVVVEFMRGLENMSLTWYTFPVAVLLPIWGVIIMIVPYLIAAVFSITALVAIIWMIVRAAMHAYGRRAGPSRVRSTARFCGRITYTD